MPNQESVTAQEECRICLSKCMGELDGLLALVDQAPQFNAGAFVQSVNHRLPQLRRHWKSSPARLSILIQLMNDTESEG